jgi:hypothetical protein
MSENQNERIEINGRLLEYGVVSKEGEYQVYLYPGMTVAEIAFCMMVTMRLLERGKYIETKDDVIKLINKYYDDPQYAPIDEKLEVPNEQD